MTFYLLSKKRMLFLLINYFCVYYIDHCPKSISETVKKCFEWVGLKSDGLTAHSLRQTAVTLILKEGKKAGIIDILEQAKQVARHAKIETTLIYAHHIDREENMGEELVANAIF